MFVKTYKDFLTEAATQAGEKKRDNNAHGVAFELNFARSLHQKAAHPEHFRDKEGRSPKEAHAHLENLLGQVEHQQNLQHAHHAAQALLEHLHGEGHPAAVKHETPVDPPKGLLPSGGSLQGLAKRGYGLSKHAKTYWVSNPSDYKQVTEKHGIEEKNFKSNADVMIVHEHPEDKKPAAVAVSLKYGKAPSEKGPGLKTMGAHIGNHESLTNIQQGVRSELAARFPHVKDKESFKALEPHEQEPIRQTAHRSLVKMASTYASGLRAQESKTPGHTHRVFEQLMSVGRGGTSPHRVQHMRVHTNPKTGQTNVEDTVGRYRKVMHGKDPVQSVEASHDGSSSNVYFHGKTRSGKKLHVGTLNMKYQSSPYSAIQATMKAGQAFKGAKNKPKKK